MAKRRENRKGAKDAKKEAREKDRKGRRRPTASTVGPLSRDVARRCTGIG
jgi:hypothetical protein